MSLLLEQEPAFCIQVDKHRGRTFGHGASGTGVSESGGDGLTTVLELLATGVVEVMPPVGVLGTHFPSLSSSVSLQDGADVVATGVDTPGVVLVVLVIPPVGVLGTHLPSLSSSSSLQVGGVGRLPSTVVTLVGGASPHLGQKVAVDVIVVVEIVSVIEVMLPLVTVTGQVVRVVITISVVTISELAGGEVMPPVGVCGTHEPLSIDEPSEHAVVAAGVDETPGDVVVIPPVGVLGTHEPLSMDEPSAHEVVAAGVDEVSGAVVVTPPVGVLGTQEPLSMEDPSAHDVEAAGVVVAVVETGVVMPPVGVFGTHEPLSSLDSVSAHTVLVVEDVCGTQDPLSIVEPSAQEVVVVAGVVVEVMPPVGVLGTQDPLSIVEPSAQEVVVVAGVVLGPVGRQVPPVSVSVDLQTGVVVVMPPVGVLTGGCEELQSKPML